MTVTNEQETVAITTSRGAEDNTLLRGAEDNTLSSPKICRQMIAAGCDRYAVDFARATRTCYLPTGENIEHGAHRTAAEIGGLFDSSAVRNAIEEAQANRPGYTYPSFCEKVVAAGCAGYLVSFLGRRAIYFGRTGETHAEHFPR